MNLDTQKAFENYIIFNCLVFLTTYVKIMSQNYKIRLFLFWHIVPLFTY